MRVLSLNFREAMFASSSDEVPIFLLTITHPELADPVYLSTDPTVRTSTDPLTYGTISRGQQYDYAGIDISLPDEQDGSPPASKLIIANVTRGLVPLARSVSTPASITIEGVLASALDAVEISWPAFDMSNLTYNALELQFDLTIDAMMTEPFPADSFSPAYFPGLFF